MQRDCASIYACNWLNNSRKCIEINRTSTFHKDETLVEQQANLFSNDRSKEIHWIIQDMWKWYIRSKWNEIYFFSSAASSWLVEKRLRNCFSTCRVNSFPENFLLRWLKLNWGSEMEIYCFRVKNASGRIKMKVA